ncbi:tripartite tricarboxylate transporter substrate-binding protein [Alisedimentitalea sp. MJ-SS2]|uniref:Bug family tripartite tricarboxylate transporter substrate binding protein n=1 Tax=Aliisedimentitalea sp. MJ-SS2 TaxID=3049795 RepID=UPI00290CF0D8|nr:tripartite tricarboxylate transporter substrate-binding protein [Alisedimentitalea sp. MJ-SS2]MDU8927120.1 tripartite tricarboxylate transporter substrate-binding protein [Alisedimentitalea sp. MJ-SS2]
MKRIFKTAISTAAAVVLAGSAFASDWTPPGPIKLMIAFKAGGGADTQARLIAEDLEAKMGWKFIPEQVTGKGGMNLAMAIKDQPNDGSVIGMVVTETLGYNMKVANAGVTPSDFTAITTTAGFQMGVVSRSEKGWKTFDEMIAAARESPLRFGAMSPKLADLAYLLGKAQGVEFNIVNVKGGKGVMNGVNAGDLDLGFMAGIQRKGVAAGDLVNLASALSAPLVQTPDAPTFADLGVKFSADGYFLIVGPGGMPAEARDALAAAIGEVISTEGMKSNGMISKAFGGAAIIAGDDAQALVEGDFEAAGALLQAASE